MMYQCLRVLAGQWVRPSVFWIWTATLPLWCLGAGASMADSRLTFAFSDDAPPYSLAQGAETTGLLPELVQLVFSFLPRYETESHALPWARAQYNVEQGEDDGLLTYPSDARREYMLFTAEPLFYRDYGNLVYSSNNANADIIESATSFANLAELTVIVEAASKWEEDNIPGFLRRVRGQTLDTMMHLLMRREAGDFLVMPAEDARFIAKKLGYGAQLKMRRVDFINESRIPFHLGLSRQFSAAPEVIGQIERVMQNPDFQTRLEELLETYR